MKEILKTAYLKSRRHVLKALSLFTLRKDFLGNCPAHSIRKILFVRIDRIGDLVLSTPALKTLKISYPDSLLTVLASPVNHALLVNNPYVDEFIVYDRRDSIFNRMSVVRQLRDYKFDLAIDPYGDYELETAFIAYMSRATHRIGYASYGREVFFDLPVPEIEHALHFVDLTMDVLKPLGLNGVNRTPEIFLSDDERAWAEGWLREKGMGGRPVIGIHPGSYYETQRWPLERFADVANQLREEAAFDLVVFGGPDDSGLVDDLRSTMSGELAVFIEPDLRRFASLLSVCRIFICNNSGPLHMAVALGTPTISFMGPTIKERWMPLGNIHTVLRMDDLPCIGCNTGHCRIKTHDCMRLITSDMVMDYIRAIT